MIVYGGLAVATLVLLAPPTVRVVREARALSRVVVVSGRRIEIAADELNQMRSGLSFAPSRDAAHRETLG